MNINSARMIELFNYNPFLEPLEWCGERWRVLSHIEASTTVEKTAKLFIRALPALLLLCATAISTGIAVLAPFCPPSAILHCNSPKELKWTPIPQHLKDILIQHRDEFAKIDRYAFSTQIKNFLPPGICSGINSNTYKTDQNTQFVCLSISFYNPMSYTDRLQETFRGFRVLDIEQKQLIDYLFGTLDKNVNEAKIKRAIGFFEELYFHFDLDRNEMCMTARSR